MKEVIEENIKNRKATGAIYGAIAFTMWGFLPLYWKLLNSVPAEEILAHRIIWSFVFVSILLLISKQWSKFISTLKNKKNVILILLCSILITINWFTYIWAINSDQIVESSLGYYINPLFSVFLGMIFLKEKLNLYQYISLILAAMGVVLITVQYGKIPWIAFILAVSFGLYGLLKKLIVIESIIGLALETAIIAPAALLFIIFKQANGTGAFGTSPLLITFLFIGAGVATAAPLLLFAKGAKRVEMSTIGFLQYISPSINLIIGIFIFKEKFTSIEFISFGFIWTALLIFSVSQLNFKKLQPKIIEKI